jgi:hypothetical protein
MAQLHRAPTKMTERSSASAAEKTGRLLDLFEVPSEKDG